jgi:hypothetical protein
MDFTEITLEWGISRDMTVLTTGTLEHLSDCFESPIKVPLGFDSSIIFEEPGFRGYPLQPKGQA